MRCFALRVSVLILLLLPLAAQARRYALILEDPPVAKKFASRREFQSQAALSHRATIAQAQASLRGMLASRQIRVVGSAQVLLNAVFVEAPVEREAELRTLPGVRRVVFLPRVRPLLDRAVTLVNASGAWNALGGVQNAGMGIKIAIIDTGIDQTHPAFQDNALPVPSGFPKCQGSDCAYTNHKIIVARSYVAQLAAGSPPGPAQSRPDDYSPRDRSGHGTAVSMVAAGETNTGPVTTITGMAPKAYLGSYKVFGSPGINDFTSGDVVISALEQALSDGMDIAILSLGSPAFSGPLDQGAVCGNPANSPCDPEAAAVENAVQAGMTVVVAAGNDGDSGQQGITLSTIGSPGTAPSAITVGASTNSHTFVNSVQVPGSGVPSNLQTIPGVFGDGPLPASPFTAPAKDVTQLCNDGLACTTLPAGSLSGSIALVQRGTCTFFTKVQNAQTAGAVGVIFYQLNGVEDLIVAGGLGTTSVPAIMIGNSEGVALKNFLDTNPGRSVTMNPGLAEVDVTTGNQMASFSSRGPVIGTGGLKPDLVAVGTDMYMAAERSDPNGDLYDPSGYTVADGTSFSTPMVAGGVALVKQAHPNYSSAQLKSAVVNTATQDVTETDGSAPSLVSMGAGKLNAGAAVTNTITIEPATLSFGILSSGSLPLSQKLKITNTGSSAVNLTLAVSSRIPSSAAQVNLDNKSFSLSPGQAQTVTATLSGSQPTPGSYEGMVTIQGAPSPMVVPYLFVVGDGVPYDAFALFGDGFSSTVGQENPDGGIAFKVVDRYGVGVPNLPVTFSVTQGGGTIKTPDQSTDSNGIAYADAYLGPNPGQQAFAGQAGGLTVTFSGTGRLLPTIAANGVVDAASFQVGKGVAPGSYISIFGTGLSDDTNVATTTSLPLALDQVSVSFDVPAAGLSLPGRVYFVSPRQVNVQVPWELRGQTSVQMKVNIGESLGQLYTAPLSDYSPAVFEYNSGNTRLAAALDANFQLIGSQHPAVRGQTVLVYANGLGPVDNPPADGAPAPSQPLVHTLAQPTVTIGGQTAQVSFSGLAPGFAALYQLNVVVPSGISPGTQPLIVTVNGVTSKTVNLPVQ